MADDGKKLNRINNISTRITLLVIALVLPLNIIAIIYTNQAQKTIIEQAEIDSQRMVDYYMQLLQNEMENARMLLTMFMRQDQDFLSMKGGTVSGYEYESAKLKFYYRLQRMAEISDGADGYYYYFTQRQDGVVYGNADKEKRLVQILWEMLADYSRDRYPTGWHIYEWDGWNYLLFLADDTEVIYGAAIRLEDFLDTIRQGIGYEEAKILLFEQSGMENSNVVVAEATAEGICLRIEIDKSDILKHVTFSQRVLSYMAFFYLLLIPLLYTALRRLLIIPLMYINEAHRQVEHGNAKYRIRELPTVIEFRELSLSFNRMVDNLERLRIESYEKELSRQKMELQNLQLQIRPHFLLNTFNMIFTLSQKQENEAIQKAVIYLSEYFRYIFREEKELELFPKERKMIQGYAAMASIRYSGRIHVEYELDPEVDFVRLPPLLIHNFVENAVKYGVKKNEILHIRLEGHYKNGIVTFQISDDGKGMTEDILIRNRRMLCGEWEPKSQMEHMGLYNSMRRLKYFYGEEAKIDVFSRLGEGTSFMLSFPYSGIE